MGNHENAPYFYGVDFYNAAPTESLAALREDHGAQHIGTCLDRIVDMFEQ